MNYLGQLFWCLALLCCLSASAVTHERAQCAIDAFAADSALRHASITVAVGDIAGDSLIASHNADLSCITASTMKAVTSSAALQLLGPDFTFKTKVRLKGQRKKDKFKGEMVIVGACDPTLGSRYFKEQPNIVDEILSTLQSLGIKKVEGKVAVDDSLVPYPATNGWWDVGDLATDYGMGIHALNYCDNLVLLQFKGVNGAVQDLKLEPAVPGVKMLTRLNGRTSDNIDVRLDEGANALVLSGSVANQDYALAVANPAPAAMLVDSLLHALHGAGIKFKPKDKILSKTKNVDQVEFEHSSPPLKDIITSLLDRSDNMMTEGLLRAIAIYTGHEGTAAQGTAMVDSLWQSRGIDTRSLFQYDGSGLARANKASGRFFVQLLAHAAKHPADDVCLHQLMPAAGKRMGKRLAESRLSHDLVVKSGSMTQVQCFVGYYPASKPEYTFAALVNNWNGSRAALKEKIGMMLMRIFDADQ